MLRIYLSLSLVLTLPACATSSSAPSELQRGTYVSPAPPPRPGVGAPQVGQPGVFEPRDYPKSPYTRVLPQNENTGRGPGLWATGDDRTSPKEGERGPDRFVFGMGLPLIPEYDQDAIEQLGVFKCAQKIEDLITKTKRKSQWLRLTMDHRFCLLAKMYEFCSHKSQAWKNELPKERVSAHWDTVFKRQIETAEGFRKNSCIGDTSTVNTLMELLTEEWDSRVGSGF